MVTVLVIRSRSQGSKPGGVTECVVFLGKVLFSHSASIHSGVKTGTSKLSGEPDEMLWGVCVFV